MSATIPPLEQKSCDFPLAELCELKTKTPTFFHSLDKAGRNIAVNIKFSYVLRNFR